MKKKELLKYIVVCQYSTGRKRTNLLNCPQQG